MVLKINLTNFDSSETGLHEYNNMVAQYAHSLIHMRSSNLRMNVDKDLSEEMPLHHHQLDKVYWLNQAHKYDQLARYVKDSIESMFASDKVNEQQLSVTNEARTNYQIRDRWHFWVRIIQLLCYALGTVLIAYNNYINYIRRKSEYKPHTFGQDEIERIAHSVTERLLKSKQIRNL